MVVTRHSYHSVDYTSEWSIWTSCLWNVNSLFQWLLHQLICWKSFTWARIQVSCRLIAPPVPDPLGSADRPAAPQKRKVSSPTHSSNGHSPPDTSPSPLKKKKKPGAVNSSSKDQVGPVMQRILLKMCCVAQNVNCAASCEYMSVL